MPLGLMETLASTNTLVAGPLLPCVLSVERVTVVVSPLESAKETTAVALAVKVPGVLLLMVMVQLAALLTTVRLPLQVSLSEVGDGLTLGVMVMPVTLPPSGSPVAV